MIKVCRVDERLLHGQVAVTWINTINPDAIVIANDEIIHDEIGKLPLKMAKPDGIKMAIRSIQQAADLINNPETKGMQIFLLVKNIHDAKRMADRITNLDYLNLGRVFSKDGTVFLDQNTPILQQDADDLISLFDKIKRIEYQMVPSEAIKDVKKILSK